MAGKFEVYKDKTNKFRFRLKAGNGEVIAVGEAYESKAGCLNGIESIRKNAPDATVVEIENNWFLTPFVLKVILLTAGIYVRDSAWYIKICGIQQLNRENCVTFIDVIFPF